MNDAFKVHMLNDQGKAKAKAIAEAFDELLTKLQAPELLGSMKTRAGALVVTKLEEACFFAKKDMANSPENSQP